MTKIWRIEKHKSKFFKGTYNKCGKYGHRASDFWVNENKGGKTLIQQRM